jgi:hypothetical protein
MYRFIDTVSIDTVSINDYHLIEDPGSDEKRGGGCDKGGAPRDWH